MFFKKFYTLTQGLILKSVATFFYQTLKQSLSVQLKTNKVVSTTLGQPKCFDKKVAVFFIKHLGCAKKHTSL